MQELSTTSTTSFFKLKYSVAIRIWHWLTFLLMAGSLVTVLFASTLFENDENEAFDKGQEQHKEQKEEERKFDPSKLSPEARAALTYSNQIWDAHKIIGFGLCFLLLSRAIIEIRTNKEERLIKRINAAVNIPVSSKEDKQNKTHYLFVKRGYLLFYIMLFIMAITGLIMAFENIPFLENINRPAKQVHSFVQYGMYAYILAHIVGVIRADLNKQKGIVSAMINGGT